VNANNLLAQQRQVDKATSPTSVQNDLEWIYWWEVRDCEISIIYWSFACLDSLVAPRSVLLLLLWHLHDAEPIRWFDLVTWSWYYIDLSPDIDLIALPAEIALMWIELLLLVERWTVWIN
jgi:hypothetical protein